jgi:hypothetical protein
MGYLASNLFSFIFESLAQFNNTILAFGFHLVLDFDASFLDLLLNIEFLPGNFNEFVSFVSCRVVFRSQKLRWRVLFGW